MWGWASHGLLTPTTISRAAREVLLFDEGTGTMGRDEIFEAIEDIISEWRIKRVMEEKRLDIKKSHELIDYAYSRLKDISFQAQGKCQFQGQWWQTMTEAPKYIP